MPSPVGARLARDSTTVIKRRTALILSSQDVNWRTSGLARRGRYREVNEDLAMIEATDLDDLLAAGEPVPAEPRLDRPWADVVPDQLRMLRLAAQPVDRATGPRPLRFVQYGRVERHSIERSLLRLEVQLPGQRLNREKNRLDVWADHRTRQVSFDPPAGLQIEPWNRGIGRFLIAQAVLWAQKRWGVYHLESSALASKDGLNEATRLRRDHVLKTHGLEVRYSDPQRLKGTFDAVTIGALLPTWNTEKVQIVEILEASSMLQLAEQNLHEMENQLRKQQEGLTNLKREDSSLRFTIGCLIAFAVFQAGLLIWIATHR
jgi:hypothetical protein